MLRAALHVLLSGSLLAGPPTAREYAGDDAAIEAPGAGGTTSEVPEPPTTAGQPPAGAMTPTGAPQSTEGTSSASATSPSASTPDTTPPTPAPVQPEGPADDEEEDELPYDPLIDSPEAQRARSWVRGGAVFLGIGAVLTGGGIAMSQAKVNTLEAQEACDARQDRAGNGCLEPARNRAAAALLVPGVLLLLGGAAMLTVGKLQQKRLRADLRASRREVVLGLQWSF